VGDNGPYGGGLGEPNVQSVLWNGPGNLIYLPTFGGSNVRATAINDSGEVVGGSTTSTSLSAPVHAFLWSQGQPMKDLGTLSGIPSSYATAINTSGVVVGYAFTGSGFEGGRAFIYEHGQMTDLNSIPGIPPGWVLNTAVGINNDGVVAGVGLNPAGQTHGYLLSTSSQPPPPPPPPPTPTQPTITWANPTSIVYGTPLSSTQLDAKAAVNGTTIPGSNSYSPAAGTILSAGSDTLSLTFTPTDTTDYAIVTDSVSIVVTQETPTIT
jgi:probable HAF family extracellular repeat protein